MRVVTFGELLLRLSAPGYTKLFQRDSLETSFCGGEANVAVSLSVFGMDSVFVTKLPDSDVGHAAARSLNYFRVDTSKIIYGEGRLGLYYYEKGASQRPSNIIYDRKNSTVALAERKEFDWDNIFEGTGWYHWTGITPALSEETAVSCLDACVKAKEKHITVSCDLNYRSKLWSPAEASSVMNNLMPYVDVCICNEEDAEKVLGIKNERIDVNAHLLSSSEYVRVAETIHERYGCRYVATTLRVSFSASRNGWSAILYDASDASFYVSREYDIQLVDRVGGGDSFAAGLIYALNSDMSNQDRIEFAAAASCLKQTMEGDFNRTSVEDVQNLLLSGGNGRILR